MRKKKSAGPAPRQANLGHHLHLRITDELAAKIESARVECEASLGFRMSTTDVVSRALSIGLPKILALIPAAQRVAGEN